MYRQIALFLLSLSSVWSLRDVGLPFGQRGNAPASSQQATHVCIFDCFFTIPFGSELVIPSNCRQNTTSNACAIEIRVELSLGFTLFGFPQSTVALDLNGTIIDNYLIELVDFDFQNKHIGYTLAYQCSYGDQCEWKYVQAQLPGIIKRDYQPLYDSVAPLLYTGSSTSNVTHCYSLNELMTCPSGVCDFTETLDFETFTMVTIQECPLSQHPVLHFGNYQLTPDPINFNHDYIYFACNINQCNSPANERAVKKLIQNAPGSDGVTTATNHSYVVVIFHLFTAALLKALH